MTREHERQEVRERSIMAMEGTLSRRSRSPHQTQRDRGQAGGYTCHACDYRTTWHGETRQHVEEHMAATGQCRSCWGYGVFSFPRYGKYDHTCRVCGGTGLLPDAG